MTKTYADIVANWETFRAWHAQPCDGVVTPLPCTQDEFEALDLDERTTKVAGGEWL